MSTEIQRVVSPDQSGDAARNLFYTLLIGALLLVDAYHIWTYSFYHISGANNGAVFLAFIMATALSLLAFILKPATIMFVNATRHEDPLPVKCFWGVIVVALMIGVWTATASSQNTLSEQKVNNSETHESRMSTLKAKELAANDMKVSAQAIAANMAPDRAQSYLAAADMRYSRAMVKISEQRTELLGNKPLQQAHGADGLFALRDTAHNAIFGLFITLSAVVATIFSCMHIKSEHRIPAFSLAKKLNHDWTSNPDNFRSSNFAVNPLKGMFNGMFFGHKRDVIREENRINDPRVIDGDAHPSSYQNTVSEVASSAEKEDLSLHFGGSKYTLSELKKHRAIYNVDGCPVAFMSVTGDDGYLILIPSPDESEWLYKTRTQNADTLDKLINKKLSSPAFTAAILRWHELNNADGEFEANSPIQEKFVSNSAVIPEPKQEDTTQVNSKRITDEFETNSGAGEIHHNSLAELNAGHPREMTEEENDIYWAEVIARLDRGESVSTPYDYPDGKGRKPQGWIDYEARELVKALTHKSVEKVNGGTIISSGGAMMFTPDVIKTVEERVAESDAQLSRNELLDDLMKLADTDDAEKKLEAISKTIDKLASDPMNHGIKFSPTKTKDELNLSYERVKALFEVKQQEGKISMTKPFKIVALKDSV